MFTYSVSIRGISENLHIYPILGSLKRKQSWLRSRFNLNLIFMSYDKTTTHSIIFGLCIIAYLVSPKADLSIPIQEVQASQATQTGEIREIPRTQTIDEKLSALHEKVCQKQINSPLCKDRALFDRLYHITEERLPNKQFFPILLGIVNAESSLWLNFAKDRVGGTCTGRNNWGGIKWKILDNWSRQFSNNNKFWYDYKKKWTDDYWCWLYPFDSIDDYWISKVNTFRFWYKACIDHKTPIWCISWPYVWDRYVHEKSWIGNTSVFIE